MFFSLPYITFCQGAQKTNSPVCRSKFIYIGTSVKNKRSIRLSLLTKPFFETTWAYYFLRSCSYWQKMLFKNV